jgi:hypothetical protein
MKVVWQVVAVVAVMHVVLFGALLGWLWSTDRLNAQRVDAVFTILTVRTLDGLWPPVQQVPIAHDIQRVEGEPKMSSGELLMLQADEQNRQQRALRRLEDEKRILLEQIAAASGRLAVDRREVAEARTSFQAQLAAQADRRSSEQFRKTVRLLDGLPPRQAKQQLIALVKNDEGELAATYLDAMQIRQAQKTLAEFKTDEEVEWAAQLLAQVREPMASAR